MAAECHTISLRDLIVLSGPAQPSWGLTASPTSTRAPTEAGLGPGMCRPPASAPPLLGMGVPLPNLQNLVRLIPRRAGSTNDVRQGTAISRPGRRPIAIPSRQSALTGMVVPLAAVVLGSVTVSSPFLKLAVTRLPSTPTGSRTLRAKLP